MTDKKDGTAERQFRYRPNPARQAIFVVVAVIGIGTGYGLAYLIGGKPAEPPPPQQRQATVADDAGAPAAPRIAAAPVAATAANPPLLPENGKPEGASRVRAYEEALPKDVVEVQPTTASPNASTAPSAPATPPAPVESKSEPPLQQQQAAALPMRPATTAPARPSPDSTVGNLPAWQKFAVAVPAAAGRPRIAIVIDDLGVDKPRTSRAIGLRPPLTLSFLTYASGLKELTAAARAAGHELMMHIPMEPGGADIDPGPNVLLTGIPRDELLASLKWNLEQFDGYVGVNNHMGSRFTADLPGMLVVMEELKRRNILFLDSMTAGDSAAGRAAHQVGVPFARRNVFLDHDDNVTSIRKQLAEVEKLARRAGHAVAIGHPREATLQALIPWLDEVEGRGFQLVPVSALIRPPGPRG